MCVLRREQGKHTNYSNCEYMIFVCRLSVGRYLGSDGGHKGTNSRFRKI